MKCTCDSYALAKFIAPDGAHVTTECDGYSHRAVFEVGDVDVLVDDDIVEVLRAHRLVVRLWAHRDYLPVAVVKELLTVITEGATK